MHYFKGILNDLILFSLATIQQKIHLRWNNHR